MKSLVKTQNSVFSRKNYDNILLTEELNSRNEESSINSIIEDKTEENLEDKIKKKENYEIFPANRNIDFSVLNTESCDANGTILISEPVVVNKKQKKVQKISNLLYAIHNLLFSLISRQPYNAFLNHVSHKSSI